MFDGSHRSRRNVDLSGAEARRRQRQRRAQAQARSASSTNSTKTSNLLRPTVVDGSGKSDVLEIARIQREERKKQQQRENSSKTIQKFLRGFRIRRIVFNELSSSFTSRVAVVDSNVPTATYYNDFTHSSLAAILSMRLSRQMRQFLEKDDNKKNSKTLDNLLEYYRYVSGNNMNDTEILIKEDAFILFSNRRILHESLKELKRQTMLQQISCKKDDKAMKVMDTSINTLLHLVSSLLESNQNLLITPYGKAPPKTIDYVFVELITCCRSWLWSNSKNNNDNISVSSVSVANTLWKWCLKIIQDNCADENSAAYRALLGATIFCSRENLFSEINGQHNGEQALPGYEFCIESLLPCLSLFLSTNQTDEGDGIPKILSGMIKGRECLLLSNVLNLWNDGDNVDIKAAAVPASTTKEKNSSLSNIVIGLVDITFKRRQDIAFLSSLVVRGEDIEQEIIGRQASTNRLTNMTIDDTTSGMDDYEDDGDDYVDDSNNDDSDHPHQQRQQRRPRKVFKRPASSRHTRQELQTIPYIDHLFQDYVIATTKETFAYFRYEKSSIELLVKLAKNLGSSKLWLSLARELFVRTRTATEQQQTCSSVGTSPQKLFVHQLFVLMQSCTGLRTHHNTSKRSTFLVQLSLKREFLECMWTCIQEWTMEGQQLMQQQNKINSTLKMKSKNDSELQQEQQKLLLLSSLTVFSDIFAYHLLAVNDEEFLRQYTPSYDDIGSNSAVIVAETVIVQLRAILYELYWTKPVLAKDIVPVTPILPTAHKCNVGNDTGSFENSIDAASMILQCRARLLLSGTKLWNSLYERWCRLVRTSPFCDESTWLFPSLISRDDTGAVHISSARASENPEDAENSEDQRQDENSYVPMDIDSDEESSDGQGIENAADRENKALAETFKDPKMARILTCIPQALPFDRRVRLFSALLNADKLKTQDESHEFRRAMMEMMARGVDIDEMDDDIGGRERVEIRRDKLYGDSMSKLNSLGRKLRRKVQVTFINQHGAHEAGIDGGGVFKEFLDDLIKEAFDPKDNQIVNRDGRDNEVTAPQLFRVTPLQTLTVNVSANTNGKPSQDLLSHYEFLGRVLGKAVYESILVEPQFCLPFLNQLLGKQNTLDDLKNFDAEYYSNLLKLRSMSSKDISGLGLTFELTTISGPNNQTSTIELLPSGSSIPVTKENVILYVHLVANRRLNEEGLQQTRAFLRGFRDLIPASWVRLFSSYELQKIISGDDTVRGIDVNSMKLHMQYAAGYHPSQAIIQWLWEIVNEMTPDQQRKFLKFMTSCSRQPLLGFQALQPPLCIQQIRLPDHMFVNPNMESMSRVTPLPTSATCMNLLKLPNYRSKKLLKKKLLDAIESGAGFELS